MFPTRFFLGLCLLMAVAENLFAAGTNVVGEQPLIESWGWQLSQQQKVAGVELSTDELQIFLRGFSEGCRNQQLAYGPDIFPDVEQLAKARREKVMQALMDKNAAAASNFIAGLKLTNLIHLDGNVFCEVHQPGTGVPAKAGDTADIHYVAHLIDGREFFDASPELVLVTNREPCRGWVRSIEQLRTGGRLTLYVPPPLSEDEAAQWGIDPGSMMIFDIQLLGAHATTPDALANALVPSPPDSPPDASGHSTSEIIEAWGWETAQRARIQQLAWDETHIARLASGLKRGIQGAPAGPVTDDSAIEKFAHEQFTAARERERQANDSQMQTFLAGLQHHTNLVELPDGLRYEILQPGTGAFPQPGQTVLVNYTGHLVDGRVFDKTMNEPLPVKVGSVIKGWNEGIQHINPGGRIRLYIPPALGYGEQSVAGIPAGSLLIYDIELVGIQ